MRKYQYYSAGDDGDKDAFGVNWQGQTFTPEITHLLGKVRLKFFKVGDPGTITVSIRATSAGIATGSDLCVGTIEDTDITVDTNGEWYEIALGNGYEVQKDVQYAIVVRIAAGDASNKISWRTDGSTPTYTGGLQITSSDSGADWDTYSGVDCMFEEWGVGPPSPTTETWGNLPKSQISAEQIEAAVNRLIQNHEDDPDAHIEAGESLQSHKASAIIDHVVNSIIEDKISDGEVSAPKLKVAAKVADAIVAASGGDYTTVQAAIAAGKKTIFVNKGTYVLTADIVLAEGISIIGEDKYQVIFDLSGGYQLLADGSTPYTTGSLTATNNSDVILGASTAFEGNVAIGDYIFFAGNTYTIIEVTDDTHLKIDTNYEGRTFSFLPYFAGGLLGDIHIKDITLKDQDLAATKGGIQFKYVVKSSINDIVVKDGDKTYSQGIRLEYMFNSLVGNADVSNAGFNGLYAYLCENNTFSNINAHNNNDSGLKFATCNNNRISKIEANNNGQFGLYMFYGVANNISAINANLNNTSGVELQGLTYSNLEGIVAVSNEEHGVECYYFAPGDECKYNNFSNIVVINNKLSGMQVTNVHLNSFKGIVARYNTVHGFIMLDSNDNSLSGAISFYNNQHGIYIYRSSHNVISGNNTKDNSRLTNDTYNEIFISDDGATYSTYNIITGNRARCTAANKAKYGIRENAAGDDYNLVHGNIVDGAITANISLQGVNTVNANNI